MPISALAGGLEGTALEAYELLAPYYDQLTSGYAHEAWIDAVEARLRRHGLGGPRVLDVACGTGKSSLPLERRGYEVTACDLSAAMVDVARRRLALPPDRVFVADMRELPPLGPFDLLTCLDDAVNYLLEVEDLRAALRSMAGVLRPGGALVFDANSLRTYEALAGESVRERDDLCFTWRGSADPAVVEGARFSSLIEVSRGGAPALAASLHRQRHHPRATVERCLRLAGLRLVAVIGQSTGARLSSTADETEHTKLLYLAQRPALDGEEAPVIIDP
jgi:SAM-dependent methyltransferase